MSRIFVLCFRKGLFESKGAWWAPHGPRLPSSAPCSDLLISHHHNWCHIWFVQLKWYLHDHDVTHAQWCYHTYCNGIDGIYAISLSSHLSSNFHYVLTWCNAFKLWHWWWTVQFALKFCACSFEMLSLPTGIFQSQNSRHSMLGWLFLVEVLPRPCLTFTHSPARPLRWPTLPFGEVRGSNKLRERRYPWRMCTSG